ncbi:uncharacterized protein [Asterias amurensis]|uniref:uncharacterized protein n=1 Tax=Asterias amurensis TaxID=7602 RepID=UPI003AB1C878
MSKTNALCWCGLVLLLFLCCIQQVGCYHSLRKRLIPQSKDLANTDRNTQEVEESEMYNRYRRFPRLHTCITDSDCEGLNRPSCCVTVHTSSVRLCKELSQRGHICNIYSRPHMWSGERLGLHCPCEQGLECISDSTSSFASRGTCMN